MGEFRSAKIKKDKSSNTKISKRLGQHSFCDFLRRYYMAKEFEIEKSSFNGYMNIFENHLIPYFDEKGILLSGISSEEINSYLLYKLNNGLSTSTVKKNKAVIGQALQSAFEKGWILSNIMTSVMDIIPEPPKKGNKGISAAILNSILSLSEVTDIFIPIMLSVRYGLDRAEILGLRWPDIDFSHKEIHIQNVVIKGSTSAYDIHPANETAVRTLPAFTSDLDSLISEHERQIAERQNNSKYCRKFYDFVNVQKNGYLLGPDNLSKKLNDLLCKNNMEEITFSDLRKAYAASLISMGFNNKAICTWLGVESFSTFDCELSTMMENNQIELIKTGLAFYRKEI